jgi:transposase InsO family protein
MSFFRRRKRSDSRVETPRQGGPRKRKVFPAEVKILAVEAMEEGLSPGEVAELVGAGKSTMIKWRKLYLEGGERALMRQAAHHGSRRLCGELERRIERMRVENPDSGVRRIRDDLRREQGIEVSAETVRRVVNDAGLGNPPPSKRRNPPGVRRFEREIPNALWQIDIFTFTLKRMYPVYLVGMIDDHSRYIVGHGLFRQQTSQSVLEVVKGAIGQWGAPREILSDNGRQFAAWRGETKFQKTLKRQGVGHVRSAPHHPMTLGKIERFWKTIWTEFLEDSVFASFADASQRLDHWIGYYNHQRPHQGIDGACPADRFYGVAGDVEAALAHGCRENSLQLALGQETRPPLYLLGKLGDTDVRVTRKGEDIEVKLGESVHEMIRVGAPFRIDGRGECSREEAADELEGLERGGAVSGGGDGSPGRGADQGALQNLRGEPADLAGCHGEGGPCGHGGPRPQEPRPQGQVSEGSGVQPFEEGTGEHGQGVGALETEVRGGHDLRGSSPPSPRWERVARGGQAPEKKTPEALQEEQDFERRWPERDNDEDGR